MEEKKVLEAPESHEECEVPVRPQSDSSADGLPAPGNESAVLSAIPGRESLLEELQTEAPCSEPPAPSKEPGLVFVSSMERAEPESKEEAGETEPSPQSPAPGPELVPDLAPIVEAMLFASTLPVPEARLREITGAGAERLAQTIEQLNHEYEESRRSFRIHRIAQGFQLYTLPEYSAWVSKLLKTQRVQRLSRAGLETLAIIAYKQPVTKPEIEQLRGVDSTAPLLTLLERKLVVLAGRAHKPGNPFLYRTTREFLRYFGLAGLDDLPRHEELEEFLRSREHEEEGAESGGEVLSAEPQVTSCGAPPGSEVSGPEAETRTQHLASGEPGPDLETTGIPVPPRPCPNPSPS